MPQVILYDYYRSSAAYRVRIALNLKGVEYESRPVNLLESQQKSEAYRAINPQGFVPMLEIDGHRLTQSLAILNYLDLRFPNQPLIPASAAALIARETLIAVASRSPRITQRNVGLGPLVAFASPTFLAAASAFTNSGVSGYTLSSMM